VCCSVLQCVAVCCSVSQYVAVCCSVLWCSETIHLKRALLMWKLCCSMLQCVVLQRVAACCSVLQRVAMCCGISEENLTHLKRDIQMWKVCCSVLQCAVLQRVAACCGVLRREKRPPHVKFTTEINDRKSCACEQKRPTHVERAIPMWKEPYSCEKCVAVCCSVLCCSVLQRVALCCNVLQYIWKEPY